MSNLTDLFTGDAGRAAVQMISKQIGADENNSLSAIQSAIPVLLGAMNRNSESGDGAESLNRALEKDHDGSILNQLNEFIPNADKGPGAGILNHVLGNRRSNVEQYVGKQNGLSSQGSSKLLEILAPIVMGSLGKEKREKKVDSSGLAGMLGGLMGSQSQSGSQNKILGALLDSDGDGDISDDLLNMGGKMLGSFFKKK